MERMSEAVPLLSLLSKSTAVIGEEFRAGEVAELLDVFIKMEGDDLRYRIQPLRAHFALTGSMMRWPCIVTIIQRSLPWRGLKFGRIDIRLNATSDHCSETCPNKNKQTYQNSHTHTHTHTHNPFSLSLASEPDTDSCGPHTLCGFRAGDLRLVVRCSGGTVGK